MPSSSSSSPSSHTLPPYPHPHLSLSSFSSKHQHNKDVPVAIRRRLQELGLDDATTLRLLAADPLDPRPTQWDTVQLCLDEGFTAEQMRKLLKQQLFLLPSLKFVRFLHFLRTLDADGRFAGRVLSRDSGFLHRKVETLERRVVLFRSLGLDNARVKRTLSGCPRVFHINEATLLKRLAWLRDFGIDAKGVRFVVQRNPNLLCLNLANNILPKIESLRNRGISTIHVIMLLGRCPNLFSLSFAVLLGKIDVLRQLGYDEDSKKLCKVLSFSTSLRNENTIERFNWLMSHGFSSDQVRSMLAVCPSIIALSESTILRKVHYLVKELNRNIEEIASYPAFLAYSFDGRIAPRFKLLSNMKAKGLIQREFRLGTILAPTNTNFEKWVLKIVTPKDSDFVNEVLETLHVGR